MERRGEISGKDTAAAVRAKLLEHCGPALAAHGVDPAAVPGETDIRACGAVDSLGFVELVVALEEEFGVELELEEIDPAELTVIGPLCEHVARQVEAAGRAAA